MKLLLQHTLKQNPLCIIEGWRLTEPKLDVEFFVQNLFVLFLSFANTSNN